ncbi:hypothetical protein R6Q57_004262 [Mikania cordata]
MEVVGKAPKRAGTTLLVLMTIQKVVSVHQDSRGMELMVVKILTNAKRKEYVSVLSANARIHMEVMSVAVQPTRSTLKNMIYV